MALVIEHAVEREREIAQRWQMIYDSHPTPTAFWSIDRQLVNCNEACYRLFGLSSKREFLDRFYELSPEYQPCGTLSSEKSDIMIDRTFREGMVTFEWLHQVPNGGREFPCEVSMKRIDSGDASIVAVFFWDNSALKAARDRLLEINGRNRLILHSTPVPVNYFNENLRVMDCNPAAARMFGFSSKREYLRRFYNCMPASQPDGRDSLSVLRAIVQESLETGYARTDFTFQSFGGVPLPVELSCVHEQGGTSPTVIAYFQDLRETGTVGEVSLDDIQSLFLTNIGRGMKPQVDPYYTSNLIAEAARLGRLYKGSKKVSFKIEADPAMPATLKGDFLLIKQVIAKMLHDSFKTTEFGIVRLYFSYERGHLEIVLNDTGEKFTSSQIDRLLKGKVEMSFETIQQDFIGLGLALANGLVRFMGGHLHVGSAPGKNNIFTVHIPGERVGDETMPLGAESMDQSFSLSEEVPDELVEAFLRDAGRIADALDDIMARQTFDDEGLRKFNINMRGVKSVLSNIGEQDLFEMANILYIAGLDGDIAAIEAEGANFIINLRRVMEACRREDLSESEESADSDYDLLAGQLRVIQAACAGYDKGAARGALRALSEGTWSKQTASLIKAISVSLLHGDFEEAGEMARRSLI